MSTTSPTTTLASFRAELYRCFGHRRDALFELLDAVTTGAGATSLVRHSLSPAFGRQWSSTCDALSDGSLDPAAIHRAIVPLLVDLAPVASRQLWALDGTTWARPEAPTCPERTVCRVPIAGSARKSLQNGWEWQWLVAIPDHSGSWIVPLSVARRSPDAGTPTEVAIAQVRAVQAARAATGTAQARPILLLDSSYDVTQLVRADLGVDILARLARNRVFVGPPVWSGRGRKPIHGRPFRLRQPEAYGPPDVAVEIPDPDHGSVRIELWSGVHRREAAAIDLTVLRIQLAAHHPQAHHSGRPKPLWLVWVGADRPALLQALQEAYRRRFAIEHAFRFLKQDLSWTQIRVRSPQAAERWSWLLAVTWVQLWLAREAAEPPRLPWEHPPAAHLPLSPGRVRRVMAEIIRVLGTPARPPKPRGMSPGRQVGTCPGRARRYPATKRGPPPRDRRRHTTS
jgi:hypothetical protein